MLLVWERNQNGMMDSARGGCVWNNWMDMHWSIEWHMKSGVRHSRSLDAEIDSRRIAWRTLLSRLSRQKHNLLKLTHCSGIDGFRRWRIAFGHRVRIETIRAHKHATKTSNVNATTLSQCETSLHVRDYKMTPRAAVNMMFAAILAILNRRFNYTALYCLDDKRQLSTCDDDGGNKKRLKSIWTKRGPVNRSKLIAELMSKALCVRRQRER